MTQEEAAQQTTQLDQIVSDLETDGIDETASGLLSACPRYARALHKKVAAVLRTHWSDKAKAIELAAEFIADKRAEYDLIKR